MAQQSPMQTVRKSQSMRSNGASLNSITVPGPITQHVTSRQIANQMPHRGPKRKTKSPVGKLSTIQSINCSIDELNSENPYSSMKALSIENPSDEKSINR